MPLRLVVGMVIGLAIIISATVIVKHVTVRTQEACPAYATNQNYAKWYCCHIACK